MEMPSATTIEAMRAARRSVNPGDELAVDGVQLTAERVVRAVFCKLCSVDCKLFFIFILDSTSVFYPAVEVFRNGKRARLERARPPRNSDRHANLIHPSHKLGSHTSCKSSCCPPRPRAIPIQRPIGFKRRTHARTKHHTVIARVDGEWVSVHRRNTVQ